jgi:hypothetical protein
MYLQRFGMRKFDIALIFVLPPVEAGYNTSTVVLPAAEDD